LEPDTKLLVTVLSKPESEREPDEEREDWLRTSVSGLARAYAGDEIKYSPQTSKRLTQSSNPDHEGR
jgi:hypothetical protein